MRLCRITSKTVIFIFLCCSIAQTVQATELTLNGLYRHTAADETGIEKGSTADFVFALELENPSYSAHEIISSKGAKRLSVRVLTTMTREDMKTFWSHWLSNAYLRDAATMNSQAWEILALLDSLPDEIGAGTKISFQSNFGTDFAAYVDNLPNFYESNKEGFFDLWLKAWFLTPALGFDAGNAMMAPDDIDPELKELWSSQPPPGFARAY